MEERKLGNGGLEVSALGLGCMGMRWAYGQAKDKQEMIEVNEWLKSCGVSYCLLSMEDLLLGEPKKNKELVRLLGLF